MGNTVIETRYLTYKQSAAYCSISRWTLYRAVKSGELVAHRIGSAIRFDRHELDRWMRGEKA